MDKSLSIIEKQNLDKKLTKVLVNINQDLDNGCSIYDAFCNNRKFFDPLIIAFIKSGDESGKMAEILDELSFYIEEDSKNKAIFKQALIYPIILLVVCIAIVGLLVNFVLPTFQDVFASSGQSLPKATIILMEIANFFKDYGLVFMIFIVVIVISIFILRKDEVIRFKLDKFNFLKLPFSSFRRLKLEYQFTSLLYILRRGDINIVSSLYIIKDSFTNTYIKMIIDELIIDLKNGYNLSSSLANKNIFSPLFLSMIKIGEDSGNLIESLKKSSEYYANDYIYKLRRMSQVAEPAIIIFMSLIVAFVVFSVAIPIFDSVNNIAY